MPPNPRSFHEEAQFQRVCAVCGDSGNFEAHHVVAKQTLMKRGHFEKLYDPRNALRLCEGLATRRCHGQYTKGRLKINTQHLTDDNICFIWQALGVAGQNYLEKHYSGVDRRYTLHEDGECPACQPADL